MSEESAASAVAVKEPVTKPAPCLPTLDEEITKRTNLYEVCVLLDSSEASRAWEKLEEWIRELLETKHAGYVLRIDQWADSRKLMYEIKGQKRASIMVVWFRAESEKAALIERDLRLDERALRHLLLRHEAEPSTCSKTADDFEAAGRLQEDDKFTGHRRR